MLRDDAVAEYRQRRTGELNPGQLEMCRLPANAELVWSEFASPPGFILDGVLVLPGVPLILKSMWKQVADRFAGGPRFSIRFRTELGESRWAHIMQRYIDQYPQLKFGSYPRMDKTWWVEVRVEGQNSDEISRVAAMFEREISRIIDDG